MNLDYMSAPELRAYATFISTLADLRGTKHDDGKQFQRELALDAEIDRIEDSIAAHAAAAQVDVVVEQAKAAPAVTVEDVRAIAAKADREKVKAILAEYGVKAFSSLATDKLPEVKSKVEALL